MKTYSVILIGAGNRGMAYADIMKKYPEKFKVVAVADTMKTRRDIAQQRHNIPDEMCFETWEDILAQPKLADVAIIATMDDLHYEPAMKAIELGYDILLEKPAAQTAEECAALAAAAEKKGVKVLVCHVLRYTEFYKTIKEKLLEGVIGDVMSGVFVEGVGNIHQSHSYIRGKWHSEEESTPMLLAKSCHDIDIIQWLLDKPCKRVQSFGELTYFKSENAPEGSPKRCIDGGCPIENECPYNAKKLYYEDHTSSRRDWFRDACARGFAKDELPTDEEVLAALKSTDYGLCVFHAENDVVDHQVVNMEFDGGATVSFSMNAFNQGGRYVRLFGTKGELYARASDKEITVYTFEDEKIHKIGFSTADESIVSGHAGGDDGIVRELYEYLDGSYNGICAADINISAKNHLIGFAAEKARRNGTVESVDKFFEEYGLKND